MSDAFLKIWCLFLVLTNAVHAHYTLNGIRLWGLLMIIYGASNHVDKVYDSTRTATINDLFRFPPVTRYCFIKVRYPMAVNLLHGVAE
ncbi:hypothetical protein D3C80_1782730 [compost metagenome]